MNCRLRVAGASAHACQLPRAPEDAPGAHGQTDVSLGCWGAGSHAELFQAILRATVIEVGLAS